MASKRTPKERNRRTIKDSPDALWLRGEYVIAVALDPWVEFRHNDHTLTREETVKAYELRRAQGWGNEPTPPDHAAMMNGYIDDVTRRDRLAREFDALGPLPADASEADRLALEYMNDPRRDDRARALEFVAALDAIGAVKKAADS